MSSSEYCMHGLIAEFETPDELVKAAQAASDAGYTKKSAYSPYYVEGLSEAMDERPTLLPYLLIGGLFLGVIIGFSLQYFTSVYGYEFRIAGRQYASWQAFIPITFEFAVLVAALTGVGTMFIRIGLPLPHHPVFNAKNINLVSHSRFFLCIETGDRNFHLRATRAFLEELNPVEVSEVSC